MNLEIEKVNTQYKYGIISSAKKDSDLERIKKSYSVTNERLEETLRLNILNMKHSAPSETAIQSMLL